MLCFLVMFPVSRRRSAGDGFKMAVKIGKIIEAAFITDLRDALMGFRKQLTGVPDADLYQELRECFFDPRFKIAAKRIGRNMRHPRYLGKRDLLAEIIQDILVDRIEPLRLGGVMVKFQPLAADGFGLFRMRNDLQDLQQQDDPFSALCDKQPAHHFSGPLFIVMPDPDALFCFFKKPEQIFIFRHFQKLIAETIGHKMNDDRFYLQPGIFLKVFFIASPQMGKIGPQQYHIIRFEMMDIVANKLPPGTLDNVHQLQLRMIMPFVIEMRQYIVPNVKGMFRLQVYL